MKEYLNKLEDGTYKLIVLDSVVDGHEGLIEVPEGALAYIKQKGVWSGFINTMDHIGVGKVLWSRHTKPEELPFVNDDSLEKVKVKVNGDLKGAIDYACSLGYNNCQFEKIPEDAYWLLCNENGTVDYSKNKGIRGEYLHVEYIDDATNIDTAVGYDLDNLGKQLGAFPRYEGQSCEEYRSYLKSDVSISVNKELGIGFVDSASDVQAPKQHSHYFIDVSDVDEIDFYEIAKRYNVTDPAVQHILKKCLAIGKRGYKDLERDLRDIHDTSKRALDINGFNKPTDWQEIR